LSKLYSALVSILTPYFPDLTPRQIEQFSMLQGLYEEWNAKINVISRKDLDNFYERHVLHSLAIAKVITFQYGCQVIDLGTGGGFPGIPLAIMFPDAQFTLVDSIAKKITVVQAVIEALELKNAKAEVNRVEKLEVDVDFIVTRAVAPLPELQFWAKGKFSPNQFHPLKNGIIALKGGDLKAEISDTRKKCKVWDISSFYKEDWFKEEKKIVYLPMT
jgi:16S rRNA (guanine527-N7)-methyltransferase